LSLGLAACATGGGVDAKTATTAVGPISIWYSNNAQEVTWGEQVVASWNASHPDQKVSGQQIPAAQSSEEVIGAAITAGSEPCLIYNTAPAAVPSFEQERGLVSLNDFPGGAAYIEARTGASASAYKSADGGAHHSIARARLTSACRTVYFLGGVVGSAGPTFADASDCWAGVCLLGGGIGALTTIVWLVSSIRS
jgi:ABC-type glycerol-3-phosphate transport system substrate-binding protein